MLVGRQKSPGWNQGLTRKPLEAGYGVVNVPISLLGWTGSPVSIKRYRNTVLQGGNGQ